MGVERISSSAYSYQSEMLQQSVVVFDLQGIRTPVSCLLDLWPRIYIMLKQP